ncbi:MAG TPA: TraR/DksA family transcriptional regulator [Candidatus Binataceae bacterium]|nr:TraR/DksA family transcriptional regulator [Candidatus Binataceae bacterium]
MEAVTAVTEARRHELLAKILRREVDDARARVQELRREQDEDFLPPPGDEMDVARSLAEVETHASLIERAEERLKAAHYALERLDEGRYGICALCGEEIAIERLRTVPFALNCIACQERRNHAARIGEGAMSRSFRRRWTMPLEMDESLEVQDTVMQPEEAVTLHAESPFGPEEGELEEAEMAAPRRRRGRPPKRMAK